MSGFETTPPSPPTWRWREAQTLARFRDEIPPLSLAERQTLVDTALRLLADYYVHLPQKQASHGVDPLARLRGLRRRLPLIATDAGFHGQLAEVFDTLSDLHTNYLLPAVLGRAVAFLPLQLGVYWDPGQNQVPGQNRVIVTQVAPGFGELAPGAEVIAWSGVPILRALERAASRSPGANPAADDAHALFGMTLRPLVKRPPPDEDWVSIQVRSGETLREIRVEWRVLVLEARDERRAASLDVQSDALRRSRKWLFPAIADQAAPAQAKPAEAATRDACVKRTDVTSEHPRNFEAAALQVGGSEVGYLRILTFTTGNADEFVAEFARLLPLLPPRGLILDVRDNGGGQIAAAERCLQLLTPGVIEPARMQMRATPAVLALCRSQGPSNPFRVADLFPWHQSVEHALETGAMYSAALPMTSPEACNAVGQRYHGPVVLVTSALSYSATDIFAAGFQDHAIGLVIGVHSCTGAGGANVWPFELLQRALREGAGEVPGLPQGAELRVALRRSLRVGLNAGLELEERGVFPNKPYDLTRRDLLEGDPNLIAYAADLLMKEVPHPLEVKVGPREAGRAAIVRLGNADRLDVLWNERPTVSLDVTPGKDTTVPLPGEGRLGLRAYLAGKLVAARNVAVAVT